MLKKIVKTYKATVMLGKVFREKEINLLYGESGVGKTVSAIKALNNEGIEPILLDFDNNDSPTENKCDYIHINGLLYLSDDKSVIPKDKVIIIDTWQLLLSNGGNIDSVNKIKEAGNTVILIAHNKPIATKKDIPDIDSKYANHFGSKLFLERDYSKKTKSSIYNLHILKCRGYKGDAVIEDWMR